MRLVRSLCLLSVLCAPVVTMAPPRRPEIQGIALVRLRVSDMKAAQHFYHEIIGLYPLESAGAKASDDKTVYFLNKDQRLELIAGTPSGDAYAIDVVGFQVSNVKQMRKYLLARGQKCEAVQKTSSGNEYVATLDPENHPIWFVSWARRTGPLPGFIHTEHMIHAGFIVRRPLRRRITSTRTCLASTSIGKAAEPKARRYGPRCKFPMVPTGWNICWAFPQIRTFTRGACRTIFQSVPTISTSRINNSSPTAGSLPRNRKSGWTANGSLTCTMQIKLASSSWNLHRCKNRAAAHSSVRSPVPKIDAEGWALVGSADRPDWLYWSSCLQVS